jgi:hypothetical protein
MSSLTVRYVKGCDLKEGDSLEFLGHLHRITGFEPYHGVHDFIDRIACVEGRGAFMSIDPDWSYRIGA